MKTKLYFLVAVLFWGAIASAGVVIKDGDGNVLLDTKKSSKDSKKNQAQVEKEEAEKEERRKRQESRQSDLNKVGEMATGARYYTLLKMQSEVNALTNEMLKARMPYIKIPGNSSHTIKLVSLTLSAMLGGTVELSDDAGGSFFDANDSEQMEVRPRRVLPLFVNKYIPRGEAKEIKNCDGYSDLWECYNDSLNYQYHKMSERAGSGLNYSQFENQSYTKLGALKHMIAWSFLKKVYDGYGLLKDYGIKNVKVNFKNKGKGSLKIDGDTLVLQVGYEKVSNRTAGGVTEQFNLRGRDIRGIILTNWWKYREYDANSYVQVIEGLPRYQWNQGVQTVIMSAAGAMIRDSSGASAQFDSVMVVTPTQDRSVHNYYIQVHSPEIDRVEEELMAIGRKSNNYPRSFIIEAGLKYAQAVLTIEVQGDQVKEEEERLLAEFNENNPESKMTDEEKREAILYGRMNAFFQGKLVSTGKKLTQSLIESGRIQDPEVIDWVNATIE